MYCVDTECPHCMAGPIGFWVCSDGEALIVICDECEAAWVNPQSITLDSAILSVSPEDQIDAFGCSVGFGNAHWATLDEIRNAGWDSLVAGESDS